MQNHDIRSLPTYKYLRALGAFLLGALCAFQVGADTLQFERFMATANGNGSQKISFGSTGQPLASAAVSGGSPVGNFSSFLDATTKGVEVRGTGQLPVGTVGRTVPVTVAGKITGAKLAQAFGALSSLAGGPVGVAALVALTVLPDVYSWLTASGLSIVDGVYKANDPSVCTVSPCYSWLAQGGAGPRMSTAESAAQLYLTQTQGVNTKTLTSCTNTSGVGNASCYYWFSWNNSYGNLIFVTPVSASPSSPSLITVSESAVLSKLEATQAPVGVLEDFYTIDKSGRYTDKVLKDYAMTNVVAAVPAVTPGPVATSVTPAQNGQPEKIITTQTDYQCGSVLADVTCTEKKTISESMTVIDPATGLPQTTTTTTTETAEAPAVEKPVDPCIEHPDRNGCREDEFDIPEQEIPTTSKTITYAAENLGFAGGTCPADRTMLIHQAGITVTAGDWATTCEKVTTYAKPMILLMATFAALLIIFGGGSRIE